MIDNSTISVFFVMLMVVLVIMALFSPLFSSKKSQVDGDNKYFWPLMKLSLLFGIVAVILVFIK